MLVRIKLLLFVLLIFISQGAATYVAILETTSHNVQVSRGEKAYLTDMLREQAVKTLPAYQGFTIMTRENINAMLPPGKSIEDCEGQCLTETGRNIAADYIIQGRLGSFGSNITLTIEMYETAGNKLVSSLTAKKANIEDIADEIEKKAHVFFSSISKFNVVEPQVAVPAPKVDKAPPSPKNTQQEKVLKDPRDGNTYKMASKGSFTFMIENLKFKTKKSFCNNNITENCDKFGMLYSWTEAVSICPEGWRLPTKQEAESIYLNLPIDYWQRGGYRTYSGMYNDLDRAAAYWTSDIDPNYSANAYFMFLNSKGIWSLKTSYKEQANSVRCFKDVSSKTTSIFESTQSSSRSTAKNKHILQDSRDGREYKTINVDSLTVMVENLKYNSQSYCYENDSKNCELYGRLYTWNDAIRICPEGWRLPTLNELQRILTLTPNQLWEKNGFKSYSGMYSSLGKTGFYWTSTSDPNYTDYAFFVTVNNNGSNNSKAFYKDQANAVRCVKGKRSESIYQ